MNPRRKATAFRSAAMAFKARRRRHDEEVDMKCRADLATIRTSMVRALSFSAALALTLNPALTPVIAADYRPVAPVAADGQMNARFLSLGVGKSIVIGQPRD